ncbi:MAG TPA: methionyl-tRNA formyltransferase [Candidatus Baltobacteraceae bacterium]
MVTLRTLFLGTSTFAVPSLRAAAQRSQVVAVVTQPDRPAGRGHKLAPSPVKVAALELGLRVYEPESLTAFAPELRGESFDVAALASYGKILPQGLLDLPRLGALNVHPSLLPRYRGATPIQTALRNGEPATGVSIMLMDAGMDTGDIVLQERVQIAPDDDYATLHDRLALVGSRLLGEALELAAAGPLPRAPQTGEPSVTRPIRKADLETAWSWTAKQIVDQVRAYAPQPCARAMLLDVPVKIVRACVVTDVVSAQPPGAVIGVRDDAALVQAGSGVVGVIEVVAPNRGPRSGAAFVRSASGGSVA